PHLHIRYPHLELDLLGKRYVVVREADLFMRGGSLTGCADVPAWTARTALEEFVWRDLFGKDRLRGSLASISMAGALRVQGLDDREVVGALCRHLERGGAIPHLVVKDVARPRRA